MTLRTNDWYDTVAENYDRYAVPNVFAQPAADAVMLLDPPEDAKVLDAGAGTGIAALTVLKHLGPRGVVVALDSSAGMISLARRKGLSRLVVGALPGLPFPDAFFDATLANFVLSHIVSYEAALKDLVRVLRPGGGLVVTAWGTRQGEFRQLWQSLAERFVDKQQLDHLVRQALPWEELFSDGTHLEQALSGAGFCDVRLFHRDYRMRVPVDAFVALRELTVQARFMKELLETARWRSFRELVRLELDKRCNGMVDDCRDAYIAVATRK